MDVPDLADFRRMLMRARAGLGSDMAEDDGWQDLSFRASLLPEDMQGVFMMIARAAKEGWPCPGDAAIARAYGSHSFCRARRLLTDIEEQGLIVCQLDGAGRRIVTLVELAWATAPGDPNAEELPAEQSCSSRAMMRRPSAHPENDPPSKSSVALQSFDGSALLSPSALHISLKRSSRLERCLHQGRQCRNGVGDFASRPPGSPHPNLVTKAGLKALEFQLHHAREAPRPRRRSKT